MKFEILVVFLILEACFVKDSSCGGGNQQFCWFYQSHFDQTLRTYSRATNNLVRQVINLLQAHAAENPFQQYDTLSSALENIVSENSGMFDTHFKNLAQEIVRLTNVSEDVVTEAFKSVHFGSPFPLSCISNLAEVGKVHKNALEKVDEEKSAIERASHVLSV